MEDDMDRTDAGTPPEAAPENVEREDAGGAAGVSNPAAEAGPAQPEPEPEHEDLEAEGDERALTQKHPKRTSRKELLELLNRKNGMLHELEKRARKAEEELKNREDRFLRLAAEFENYKKRTRREWDLHQKQANADLIREIVGGIDNFDRALANLGAEDGKLHEGIALIHAGLMDILRKAGLTEIEALHRRFDPQVHEAVGEAESEVEDGCVAEVVQRGYLLNGQMLRPARVVVSRKKR